MVEKTKTTQHGAYPGTELWRTRRNSTGTREITVLVKNNIISPEKIDESIINRHLYAQNLPDVDLLIRTSGEQRISNFMLWHLAYAELYFTSTCWPDFDEKNYMPHY